MAVDEGGRVMKWLKKTDEVRVYINGGMDMVFKFKKRIIQAYKPRWVCVNVVKWDPIGNSWLVWTPVWQSGEYKWKRTPVNGLEEIQKQFNLPITQDMLDTYEAIVLSRKLKE